MTTATERRKTGSEWVRWGVMLAIMLGGWIWSAGRSDARVESLAPLPEVVSRHEIRISVIESQMAAQSQAFRRIEEKLDAISERQQREMGRSGR